MEPNLSDPGAHFLEESKRIPFHELPKDAPATFDEILAEKEALLEIPKQVRKEEAPSEVEKFGTITFRDDSVSLAELKRRSVSSRLSLLLEDATMWLRVHLRKGYRRKLLLVSGLILLSVLIAGGAWGATWYVRHEKSYPTLSVLPEHPDLVLEVNINSDSKEYALLEKHASAFPGYGILKKALDPVGEGKTLSRMFQDSLKQFNIDFEGDIKPVLGDSAYVVVSDMSPVGESLQKSMVAYGAVASEAVAELFFPERKMLALSNEAPIENRPEVLGEMTVYGEGSDFAPKKPVDFLVASPVRDTKKMLQIMEQMRANANFQMTTLSYRGFPYFKISMISGEGSAPDDVSRFVRFRTLYHAIVGGNWVCASSEGELKRVFDRQSERSVWSEMVLKKSSPSLSNDSEFQSVRSEIGNPSIGDALLIGYFNVASDAFFKKPSCSGIGCLDMSNLFRYPERIVLGWSIGCTDAGVDVRWTSASDGESFPGKSESNRLSSLVPQKADGRWLNIFSENDGLKNRFYNFKRSRLTDVGRDEWEKIRSDLQRATGMDIERDVIDHLSDSVAVSVLTAKDVEPEGVLVARVDDPQAVRGTIEKGVDFIRNMLSKQRDGFGNFSEIYRSRSGSFCNESLIRKECLESVKKEQMRNNDLKRGLDVMVAAAHLTETATPDGMIYSFKLSKEFPYSFASFDFGFRDNMLVFGTHFAAVQSFLHEMGASSTEKKLSQSDFYQRVKSDHSETSYQDAFVVLQGVWDVAEYVARMASEEAARLTPPPSGDFNRERDDVAFSLGAILRTIKFVGSDSVSRNGFETSSVRLVIEPLPVEEKRRAERVLEGVSSEISSMDSR